jgi:hypothetical protein
MRLSFALTMVVAGFLSLGAQAQGPAGSTAVCKDGSYSHAASIKGACSRHGGVKSWIGTAQAAPAPAAAPAPVARATVSTHAPMAKASTPPATTQATVPAPAPAARVMRSPSAMPGQPAAGGGAGMVWVNSKTKVYHCSGDRWYGKTKSGAYMTQADAQAKGNHPEHGKACS